MIGKEILRRNSASGSSENAQQHQMTRFMRDGIEVQGEWHPLWKNIVLAEFEVPESGMCVVPLQAGNDFEPLSRRFEKPADRLAVIALANVEHATDAGIGVSRNEVPGPRNQVVEMTVWTALDRQLEWSFERGKIWKFIRVLLSVRNDDIDLTVRGAFPNLSEWCRDPYGFGLFVAGHVGRLRIDQKPGAERGLLRLSSLRQHIRNSHSEPPDPIVRCYTSGPGPV